MADASSAVLGAGPAVQFVAISGWVVVRSHFSHYDYMPHLGSRQNLVAAVGHLHCSFSPSYFAPCLHWTRRFLRSNAVVVVPISVVVLAYTVLPRVGVGRRWFVAASVPGALVPQV